MKRSPYRLLRIAGVMMLLLAVCSGNAAEKVRTATLFKRSYSRLVDIAAQSNMRVRSGSSRIELWDRSSKCRMVLFKDKRYGFFNNVRFNQVFPATIQRGSSFVSSLDYRKTFLPLLGDHSDMAHPVDVIVIDPGHGGKDQGASNRKLLEKNITLRLSLRVADLLRKRGYKVYLTRTKDVYLPLESRPALANRRKADLFLSLHVNSAGDKSVQGIETFSMTPAGGSSTNAQAVDWNVYPGNQFDANNFWLSYQLQRSLLIRTGAEDRGVKRARFAVLRTAECPAALVEVGFISHPQEAGNLASAAYLEKIANGIVDGIVRYHSSLK